MDCETPCPGPRYWYQCGQQVLKHTKEQAPGGAKVTTNILKGTVGVVSSDSPSKDAIVRFTTETFI